MHQDFLYTIAQLAATLAGFSGVVFALGGRARGEFSQAEKNGLFHLLFTTCGNMIVTMIVAALVSFSVSTAIAWRVGAFLMGLFVFVGAGRAIYEEVHQVHSLPRALAWVVPIVALVVAGANIAAAVGLLADRAEVLCVGLSIYLLFVAVCYFASLLVPETTGRGQNS